MEFENNLSAPPSRWSAVRDHLPMLLLAGGFIALFFGLHMAANGVVILAAIHLVLSLLAVGVRWLRQQRNTTEKADAR